MLDLMLFKRLTRLATNLGYRINAKVFKQYQNISQTLQKLIDEANLKAPNSATSEDGNEGMKFSLPFHLRINLEMQEELPFLLKVQKLQVPRNLENDFVPRPPRPVSEVWFDKEDIRLFNVELFLPTKYDDPEYLRQETIWVYRKLLRESLKFIDERARIYLIREIKAGFREFQNSCIAEVVDSKRDEARKLSRKIAKANRYDMNTFLSILEEVYGRCSKVKLALLEPYLPSPILFEEKYKPDRKKEITLHSMILSLVKFQELSLTPGNISGAEHSFTRLFNLFRRHYKRIVHEKVIPPLPNHLIQELEARCDTQYHVYHAMHYPLDPKPGTKMIIGRVDKRFGPPPREPMPPNFARLRSVARCYQKLMKQVPIQTSGPDYYSFQDSPNNSRAKFTYSEWAGGHPFPSIQAFDSLLPGEADKYLQKHMSNRSVFQSR